MLKNVRHLAARSAILLAGSALSTVVMAQTVTQAVQHALHTNPNVQFDIANRFAVGEELNQAKAGWLPVIDLAAGVGREKSRNPTSAAITAGGGSWITLTRRESSADLVQNIFNGFGTISEVRRQRAHLHSAAYKIVETAQDTALDTVNRYLDVLRYQHLLQEAQKNLAVNDRILRMIKQRSDSGLGRTADLDQAKSRVALARSNVVAERGHLRDARTSFIRVVGQPAVNLKWPKSPSSKVLPRSLKQALVNAHKDHPAIKSIVSDVVAAEAQHNTAISDMFPKVDFVLSASRNRDLDGIRGPNYDQMFMFRARYNIFRGGENLAKTRETAYQIQEAGETRNRVVADTDEEVRLSWEGLNSVQDRIVYLRQHRRLAASTFDAYNEQFKVGKRTLLDLLDAQNEYFRASLEYYNGLHDEVLARYSLLHSVGRLLDYMKVPVPAEATIPESSMFRIL